MNCHACLVIVLSMFSVWNNIHNLYVLGENILLLKKQNLLIKFSVTSGITVVKELRSEMLCHLPVQVN